MKQGMEILEQKSLREILKAQMDIKGLTKKRLADLTGISERYIEGLMEGNFLKLPSAPYVRGYLIKISSILDLDAKETLTLYKKEEGVKTSGPTDKMPHNRFAIKPINKKFILAFLLILLVGAYLIKNASRLIGEPELTIANPFAQTAIVANPLIELTGKINPKDKLLINNEETAVNSDGTFEKLYNLQIGLNTVEFSAKKILGREARVVKQIIYQPQF